MHHTAHTAPGTSGVRPLAAAVLAAVVLTLLAALGLAGPAATGGPTADVAPAAGTGHDLHSGPRADDGCDTACTVRAATRQEPHRDHPAPRCHLAPCAQGTALTPPALARLSTRTRHAPSASDPHASQDRGRAPPGTSGT
ncbi:hypothetical protein AB0K93_28970 [Streptomyces sp. NPDC052676]|uniref:hypothetical protein n=1 Tax=Streptomyces sp. NPDC052676 TaxID=3154953 RepID=UPI00343A6D9D